MASGLSGPGLPLFLTPRNKYPVGAAMFAFAALIYLACNHFHLFEPRQLPMSAIDLAVPFVPTSVWIYVSEYVYFPLIFIAYNDLVQLNKYLYSFMALQIVSCLIFVFWPTVFPRELFPLPAELDPLTREVFEALRRADTPANCCPSLHVSSVYLSALIFLDGARWLFPVFLAWGTAIAFSTLTTKQHYFADVVTGLAMALLGYWLFHRRLRYRAPSSNPPEYR